MATLGPLPPVNAVLRIVMSGINATRPWVNILHFSYTGPGPSNASCQVIANATSNAWVANVSSLQPSPIVLTQVVVTDLTSTVSGEGVFATNDPGTRGDDVIGANTAMLISYPVNGRFRGGHPRSYLLVGGNADNQDGMNWHPAFVTEVQTHWRAFLTAVNGASVAGTALSQFGFVRYVGKFLPNSGPPRNRLDTPLFIGLDRTAALANEQMASQRRRIGRVRR